MIREVETQGNGNGRVAGNCVSRAGRGGRKVWVRRDVWVAVGAVLEGRREVSVSTRQGYMEG